MSALRLPHTATRLARESTLSAENEREAPGTGASRTYRCQITPMAPQAAYEQFNVQLDSPFLVICKVVDARAHKIGDVVEWDGQEYVVKQEPAIYEDIGPADHGSFVIERSGDS